jgi:hypothetical protein
LFALGGFVEGLIELAVVLLPAILLRRHAQPDSPPAEAA